MDDEDDAIPQDRDWTAYWRLLFRKVTTRDIEDFEKNYKGISWGQAKLRINGGLTNPFS